jgi:hypothetical protein
MGNVSILKGGSDHGDVYNVINGETINAMGNFISDAIPMENRTKLGVWYLAKSATGLPVIRLHIDMSPDADEEHFVIPNGISDLETAYGDLNALTVQYVGAQATARITIADYNGITIQYVGFGPTGEVEITENALNLYVGGSLVQSYDLTAAANDTITEIVALIDALAEWTCAKHANMDGAELSKHLKIIDRTDCKTGAINLAMDRCIFAEAPNGTPDTNFGPAGKMFLRLGTVDTITEIAAIIDAFADWTGAKHANAEGGELSKCLKLLTATACKVSPVTCVLEWPKIKSLTIPAMEYIRFRASGVSGNPADTVVWLKAFVQ